MLTNWQDWQDLKKMVEQFVDRARGDGFLLGTFLPEEQVDDHHKALQHLREIDFLMGRMYVRGQRAESQRKPVD